MGLKRGVAAMAPLPGKILVVDDEISVRKLISAMLAAAGYRDILEAEDGLAAYQVVQQAHSTLRLVITDIQMARMTGRSS